MLLLCSGLLEDAVGIRDSYRTSGAGFLTISPRVGLFKANGTGAIFLSMICVASMPPRGAKIGYTERKYTRNAWYNCDNR